MRKNVLMKKFTTFFAKGVYKSFFIVYNSHIHKGCERKDAVFDVPESCAAVDRVV